MSLYCKLDWLSFTWKSGSVFNPDEFEKFRLVFPEIDNILIESVILRDSNVHGKFGKYYDHVLGFNDYFDVSFNLHDFAGENQVGINMGVNVSVPAHGLEFFFGLFGFKCDQVVEMLQLLKDRGCSFSRLDFAYDDYFKTFTPKDYTRWGVLDQIVSPMKRINHVQSAQDCGWTFYMGTRDSGKYLRIYDKEYQSKGQIKAIRYEFELHKKYTGSVVDWILENKSAPYFHELISWFILKVVGKESQGRNRAHMDTLPEWESFISASMPSLTQSSSSYEPVQLVATKSEDCLNDVLKFFRWYKRQIGRKAAAIKYSIGADAFNDLVDSLSDQDFNEEYCHYYLNHKKVIENVLFDENGYVDKDWKTKIFNVS